MGSVDPAQREAQWSLGPGRAGLVSVIVPTHDREALLRDTLGALRGQTHPNLEVIVVDDGSSDGTSEFLARQDGIRCLRQEHGGAPRARNQGALHSSGAFIQFLDSDDLLLSDKLLGQARYLDAHGEADAVYGVALGFVDPDPAVIRYALRGAPRDKLNFHLRGYRLLAHLSSVLWRRSAIERIGPWDERLSRWQDWDYLLRALVSGLDLAYDGSTRSLFRVGRPGSITTTPYSSETCETLLYAFRKAERLLREHGKDSPGNLGALCARGLDTAGDLRASGRPEAAAELVDDLGRLLTERRVAGLLTRWFLRRWSPERSRLHQAWTALALAQYGLQTIAMRLGIA